MTAGDTWLRQALWLTSLAHQGPHYVMSQFETSRLGFWMKKCTKCHPFPAKRAAKQQRKAIKVPPVSEQLLEGGDEAMDNGGVLKNTEASTNKTLAAAASSVGNIGTALTS